MDINIKELLEMTVGDLETELQDRLNKFNELLAEKSDVEELKALELEVDKVQEEIDAHVREAEYELNLEPIEFEGKKYSLSEVARKIVYHLNRVEQPFQYSLGLHGLVRLWKNAGIKTITYGAYDSTLRILGDLKYKGDNEWVDILVINNYLTCCHEPYQKDRLLLSAYAEMRNAAVNAIQMHTPVATGAPVGEGQSLEAAE